MIELAQLEGCRRLALTGGEMLVGGMSALEGEADVEETSPVACVSMGVILRVPLRPTLAPAGARRFASAWTMGSDSSPTFEGVAGPRELVFWSLEGSTLKVFLLTTSSCCVGLIA